MFLYTHVSRSYVYVYMNTDGVQIFNIIYIYIYIYIIYIYIYIILRYAEGAARGRCSTELRGFSRVGFLDSSQRRVVNTGARHVNPQNHLVATGPAPLLQQHHLLHCNVRPKDPASRKCEQRWCENRECLVG